MIHDMDTEYKIVEAKYDKVCGDLMLIGSIIYQICNLLNVKPTPNTLVLVNEKNEMLSVYSAAISFGYPNGYTMEDYAVMNDMRDPDEILKILETYEEFNLDKLIIRCANFTKSEQARSFLKANREALKKIISGHIDPAISQVIFDGEIIFAYLKGYLNLNNIPTDAESLIRVAGIIRDIRNKANENRADSEESGFVRLAREYQNLDQYVYGYFPEESMNQ